jgi:hypothetical protein
MFGEQYGVMISTAISAGMVITLYPAYLEQLIFGALILWLLINKLIKWADSVNIGSYIKSFLSSTCAIFGLLYMSREGLVFFMLGYIYVILAIYMMRIVIVDISEF